MSDRELDGYRDKLHKMIDRLYDVREQAARDKDKSHAKRGYWLDLELEIVLDTIALVHHSLVRDVRTAKIAVVMLVELMKMSRQVSADPVWNAKADQLLIDFIIEAAERSGIGKILNTTQLGEADLAELLGVPNLTAALDAPNPGF